MDPSDPPLPEPNTSTISHRPAGLRQEIDSPGSSNSAGNAPNAPIPDEEHGGDMPMTMTASVVLTSLPRDAHQALTDTEAIDAGKGWLLHTLGALRDGCLTSSSHGSLPASPISTDFEEPGIQNQCIAEV